MNLPYCYVKAAPLGERLAHQRRLNHLWRGASLTILVVGVFFISNATFPILFYEMGAHRFEAEKVNPVASQEVTLGAEKKPDYTNPQLWFPAAPVLPPQPSRITHYTLSIPKLGIEDATVQIGGEDLMESLIHYPGTAMPGQYGNAVIFGHSVLPQFFNPENYRTIFSTLPTLKEKDEILVDYDGIRYRYLIRKIAETTPDDVTVLEQTYESQWLSLITCVPPGTYLKRLIVRAQLVKI